MAGDGALIRLRDVSKRYGDRLALHRVDLSVVAGRLLAVVGPSGAGKTTLLNVLLGWEQADEGSVERAPAVEPSDDGLIPWQAIAVIPQQRGLLADLSILDNVHLPCRLADGSHTLPGAAVLAQLDRLELGRLGDRYPDEVSLGEQQRASVARALVVDPAIVLADEPTAHQDAASATLVLRELRAATDGGAACVMVTHDAAALRHADVVVEAVSGAFRQLPNPSAGARRHRR